jgi:hypothetical protein
MTADDSRETEGQISSCAHPVEVEPLRVSRAQLAHGFNVALGAGRQPRRVHLLHGSVGSRLTGEGVVLDLLFGSHGAFQLRSPRVRGGPSSALRITPQKIDGGIITYTNGLKFQHLCPR